MKISSGRFFAIVYATGLATLVIATWRLWLPASSFPTVSTFEIDAPSMLTWVCLISLGIGCALTFLRRAWRMGTLGMLLSLSLLVVLNEHRLQPWAWQSLLAFALILAGSFMKTPVATTTRLLRGLTIGIYFWSAVSKLDHSFAHKLGPYLIDGLFGVFGGSLEGTSETTQTSLSLLLPAGELLVAALLVFPRTRVAGILGAGLFHWSLTLTLGPLGLNHSAGVVVWNLVFLAQTVVLFARRPQGAPPGVVERILLAVVVGFPVLEPVGVLEPWMGWAVYASNPAKLDIYLSKQAVDELKLKEYVLRSHRSGDTVWFALQYHRWSLKQTGTPVPPGVRFAQGLANRLAGLVRDGHVRTRFHPRADRFTGRR